ncbi:PREDICTED: uncharacterized protein LOC108449138 isoform X1 [Corvus brachyrhynchos]|uniref:uncharacterized protein LOC108449138 isoform X1 n=1 Tax=Corvus brachyrhynchos TaxID=85066 RepID=UPI0008163A9D|nr:PREDICTED: uncharacterized protein LOC108449138 isoform X1 [Corvus brachyrhynchos]
MSLFHRDDIFEQKAAGYVEVVQSNGHSVSLSFGAVSDCRREGRLPPLSLRSPETQRGRAAPHGVGAGEGGTASLSGGLQGCSFGASSGPGTGPGRSPCLASTRKPSPADAGDTRLSICSISEKAQLGAGSVLTAAVPDGGGGFGSAAPSQRVNVFTCNLSLNVQCLSCSGVLRPSQWIGSSFGAECIQERCIPTKTKSGKNTRRPVWMNEVKLKHKKEDYRGWNQGQIAWNEYREINWAARDQNTNTKALMELNPPMNIRATRKASIGKLAIKGRLRMIWTLSGRKWITQEMKKTELSNDFSALVFNRKCPRHAA